MKKLVSDLEYTAGRRLTFRDIVDLTRMAQARINDSNESLYAATADVVLLLRNRTTSDTVYT